MSLKHLFQPFKPFNRCAPFKSLNFGVATGIAVTLLRAPLAGTTVHPASSAPVITAKCTVAIGYPGTVCEQPVEPLQREEFEKEQATFLKGPSEIELQSFGSVEFGEISVEGSQRKVAGFPRCF